MVTWRDLKEAKSSWAPRGILMGQSTSSWWGEPDSSAHKRVNPRGAGGLLLGTRANSSGCLACSDYEAVGLLGMSTLINSSALGCSDKALSASAGVMESFLDTSNMSRSNRSPLSSRGARHCAALVLLCRASLGTFHNEWCTSGGPWPVQLFLHAAPLENPGFLKSPLGEDSPFTPSTPKQGRVVHEPSFSCCAAGILKAMACWWAIPFTWMSPKCCSLECRRDQNSLHHSDTLPFFWR